MNNVWQWLNWKLETDSKLKAGKKRFLDESL
jgi:hypothetical protein